MLQVLPDSDIPKTWLGFDKSFFSPDFPVDYFFAQDSGRSSETKPHAQFEMADYPSSVAKNDQFRALSWMKPLEYQARNISLPSRKPMVQKQLWREGSGCRAPFAPFEPQPLRVQPFEPQHRPIPQDRYLPTERVRTLSLPEINGRYMESDAKCLVSGNQTFKDVKSEDPSPNMFHPVPRPNLYLATNSLASFMDIDDVGQTPPVFDCADDSKRQRPSLDLGDASFPQSPGLMNDSAGGVSPFQMKGSPDTDSVSTDRHYTPTQAPLPWPAYKLPSQWNTQHQENWPELNWPNLPLFPHGAHNPGYPTEFDNSMLINENLTCLPPLNSNFQNQQSTFLPSTCRPGINLSANPPYDFYNVPDIDHTDPYHDNTMYSETQTSTVPDSLDQDRRDYRTIACHSENRNALLIEWKRRGLSYKDIKLRGGFKEAESTLRGRYRTLTKSKEQRVRKPQWQPRDVSGLPVCRGVFADDDNRFNFSVKQWILVLNLAGRRVPMILSVGLEGVPGASRRRCRGRGSRSIYGVMGGLIILGTRHVRRNGWR